MAEEFDANPWLEQRTARRREAERRQRHASAAQQDMDYLEALQRESRRRTGQELSPNSPPPSFLGARP